MAVNRKQRRAVASRERNIAGPEKDGADAEVVAEARRLIAAGRDMEAESLLAAVIDNDPGALESLKLSGMLAIRQGRSELAERRFGRARVIEPQRASHANNQGLALRALRRLDEAEEAFRAALAIDPKHAKAHNNLALVLADKGQADEAIRLLRRALELDPDYVGAACQLGRLLRTVLRNDESALVLREAVKRHPASNEALAEYGTTLDVQRLLVRSEKVWRTLAARQPENASWIANLGHALMGQGRAGEAAAAYQRAIALSPGAVDVRASMGELRKMQGRLEEARGWVGEALAIVPDLPAAHSNLLVMLNYDSEDPAALYAEHRAWAARHVASVVPMTRRQPLAHGGARLRIGYVSPDFRQHSAAYFLEPLLEAHDRSGFEIHCYSGVTREDEFTARCRTQADSWVSTLGLDDDSLAERITADGIDILVDVCGHFGGHRLLAFARRPAPVQVTWMGYPATTGLGQVDYRVTDAIADPPGEADGHHSEKLVRLDGGFLCYRPYDGAPDVAAPPCLRNRRVTFGSFNNLAKVTPKVVACWSRLLDRVPGSLLLLKDRGLADAATRAYQQALFASHGVEADRLQLSGRIENLEGHLALYGEVDIGLDPFPYNGTTTTCEALWMGVPVVTLSGNRHASRVGASLLAQLALVDLVAHDENTYIDIAADLAGDVRRLDALRRDMRDRMAASSLTDKADFARRMEAAYREMAAAASS